VLRALFGCVIWRVTGASIDTARKDEGRILGSLHIFSADDLAGVLRGSKRLAALERNGTAICMVTLPLLGEGTGSSSLSVEISQKSTTGMTT